MADAPVSFLPLGAIIQTLEVGGINIVQGFPRQSDYEAHNAPYFGETIGRVANRIGAAKIDSLNGGKSYALATNNGPNNLHGGVIGWGKRIWDGPKPVGVRSIPGLDGVEGESVVFSLVSQDGDEGFPGTVEAKVIYTAAKQKTAEGKEAIILGIEYEAELVSGADETVINMTNHSYFNLSSGPSIEGTEVTLVSDTYLPVDDGGIPTGGPTKFTQAAVSKPFVLGPVDPDIDDCFVVRQASEALHIDTRSLPLTKVVTAHHPESKIHLEVLTTEPAFQFYTGKYIDAPAVSGAPARGKRSGFCVEPSRYVNACNVDEWKGQMLLKKGDKYGCRIVYRTWRD